jgi:hypothetical protein
MKIKLFLALLLLFLNFSQDTFAQLKLNGGGKINISGGTSSSTIFFVLNNPISTPLATSDPTDGIIMEAEYNRLQYNLGTATTAITVPYMSSLLESFPLTLNPTSAGVGSGQILFSTTKATTRSTGFDNSLYKPSDITTMSTGVSAIDRFWLIDATNYTTKPAVNLSFSYIDAEWATNGGNSINEAGLKAQRYNNEQNNWQVTTTFPATGTINTTGNTVSNVSVSASNFYRTWTLSDQVVALPVQLLLFDGQKLETDNELFWITETELNNKFFTVEKTTDGQHFETVGTLNGAVNSAQNLNYSLIDNNVKPEINYYRLKQTDFDGKYTFSEMITIDNRMLQANKEIMLKTNVLGQEVIENYRGLVIIVYADGTSMKVIQ